MFVEAIAPATAWAIPFLAYFLLINPMVNRMMKSSRNGDLGILMVGALGGLCWLVLQLLWMLVDRMKLAPPHVARLLYSPSASWMRMWYVSGVLSFAFIAFLTVMLVRDNWSFIVKEGSFIAQRGPPNPNRPRRGQRTATGCPCCS